MTPRQWYARARGNGELEPDSAQEALFDGLQALYEQICRARDRSQSIWTDVRALLSATPRKQPRGLYIWGGVGRGKTLAMNVFHDALPTSQKLRIHFHSFMQRVHGELKHLVDLEDPLASVAKTLAAEARILCLDEFQVSDIADAMILGRLLRALFGEGVVLVATSNTAPDDLYHDGLQREQFRPAIDLLREHTRVVHLGGDVDYRLRMLERAEIYHYPLDCQAEVGLDTCFRSLCPINAVADTEVTIGGRKLAAKRVADGILWVDFSALCDAPRAASDYIEIAKRFHTVLLSDVPCMDDDMADPALRFIHAIDEFYDRHVNLIVSAAGPPEALYQGSRLTQRFERTASRLVEMRSHAYLAHNHTERTKNYRTARQAH